MNLEPLRMLIKANEKALSLDLSLENNRFALSDEVVRASPILSSWVTAGIFPKATAEDNIVGPADFASKENYLKQTRARRQAVKWFTLFTKWAVQEGLSPTLSKEIIEEHLENFRHYICADSCTWDDFVTSYFARHKIGGASLFLQWYMNQRTINHINLFSNEELSLATHDFSRALKCSEGKHGVVYKGIDFCIGEFIAVKRFKKVTDVSFDEALYEVAMNSFIKKTLKDCFPNDKFQQIPLLSLLGFAPSLNDPLLVFEYMPNGNLSQHLQGYYGNYLHSHPLDRLGIAINVARALKHLHCNETSPICHGDVKATNILLDNHFKAKLADFQVAKVLCSPDQIARAKGEIPMQAILLKEPHSIGRSGTRGYTDPICEQTRKFSDLSDIYSFGVVLLELATLLPAYNGKRSVTHLTDLVRMRLRSGSVSALLNPKSGCCVEAITTMKLMLLVGLDCCSLDLQTRPRIAEVERNLQHLLNEFESRDRNLYVGAKIETDCLPNEVAKNYKQLSQATKFVVAW